MPVAIVNENIGSRVFLRFNVLNVDGKNLPYEVEGLKPEWQLISAQNVNALRFLHNSNTCVVSQPDPPQPGYARVHYRAMIKVIKSVEYPDVPDVPAVPMEGDTVVNFLPNYQPVRLVAVPDGWTP